MGVATGLCSGGVGGWRSWGRRMEVEEEEEAVDKGVGKGVVYRKKGEAIRTGSEHVYTYMCLYTIPGIVEHRVGESDSLGRGFRAIGDRDHQFRHLLQTRVVGEQRASVAIRAHSKDE